MNEILTSRDILINSDNDGILKELLSQTGKHNALWGPEYIIMHDKNFIENHANEIIDMMVKIKTILFS